VTSLAATSFLSNTIHPVPIKFLKKTILSAETGSIPFFFSLVSEEIEIEISLPAGLSSARKRENKQSWGQLVLQREQARRSM
jgi:hypothetical protein